MVHFRHPGADIVPVGGPKTLYGRAMCAQRRPDRPAGAGLCGRYCTRGGCTGF